MHQRETECWVGDNMRLYGADDVMEIENRLILGAISYTE